MTVRRRPGAASDHANRWAGVALGRNDILALVALALAVFAIYGQTLNHQFVAWDDTSYVSDNARVLRGLTPDNVHWAFTTFQLSNWHPLTLLSHMLDVSLWGTNAGAHALTNATLHAANAALVFLLLRRLLAGHAGDIRRSSSMAWIAALLFAVHPLHVESVAWISQRKDVLCLFFSLAALLSYCRYAAGRTVSGYLAVTVFAGLALLSKPMAVTLPLLMFLLDLHPACRAAVPPPRSRHLFLMVAEKTPWLLMALGTGILTLLAQKNAMPDFDLVDRVHIATVAYGWYLWKTLWPSGLHYYYLTENALATPAALAAGAALCAISVAAWRWRREQPSMAIGWVWFVVALLPVVGFIKVGTQAWADRYAYLPHVGLFLALAAAVSIFCRERAATWAMPALAAICVALGVVAYRQVGVWKDTSSLYARALTEAPDHYPAIMGLANLALAEGRHAEAAALAHRALALSSGPGLVRAMNMVLGDVSRHRGDHAAATEHYRIGRAVDPVDPSVRVRLGLALLVAGQPADAEPPLREALALEPEDPQAGNALGIALAQTGRYREAADVMRAALQHAPADRNLHLNLVTATLNAGDKGAALALLDRYEVLFPGDPRATRIRESVR